MDDNMGFNEFLGMYTSLMFNRLIGLIDCLTDGFVGGWLDRWLDGWWMTVGL